MSRWKKFWALSAAEKKIFLTSLYGLPIVYLRLRLFGFKHYLASLQRITLAESHPEIDSLPYAAQTSYLVNGAARLLFRREACLERSIMLWSMLRRQGIEGDLKIGVATENKSIRAHAWVEIDGDPINEKPWLSEQFAVFNSSFISDYRDFS